MANRPFDHCSDAYARFRPGYPAEAINRLLDRLGGDIAGPIADVGAGTGIFTRLLAGAGRPVVAVDPSFSMLGHAPAAFAPAASAGVDADAPVARVVGVAEKLPLATGAAAAVTCAQCFHWFNPRDALPELARILRPDGVLLLLWNNRDVTDPFVSSFEKLVKQWNHAYRCEYRRQDWEGKIAAAGGFSAIETEELNWSWRISKAHFVGFTRSVSYIRNVVPAAQLGAFEDELGHLLDRHFDEECLVPYRTELIFARRQST